MGLSSCPCHASSFSQNGNLVSLEMFRLYYEIIAIPGTVCITRFLRMVVLDSAYLSVIHILVHPHPWSLALSERNFLPQTSPSFLFSYLSQTPFFLLHFLPFSTCSIVESCPTLRDSMDYSMPGFSALHHLPQFAQIHAHWVIDTIQPSHPQLPSSSFAFNLSQYQGLF